MVARFQPSLFRLVLRPCPHRSSPFHHTELPPQPCCHPKHQASKFSGRRLPLSASLRRGYRKICCRKIIIGQPRSRRVHPPAIRPPRPGMVHSLSNQGLPTPPSTGRAYGVCCPWLRSLRFWAGPDTWPGKVVTWTDCFKASRAHGAKYPANLRQEFLPRHPSRIPLESISLPRNAPSPPDHHVQHVSHHSRQRLID
jgi:hypothetical protein